jgi:hypothetical protein
MFYTVISEEGFCYIPNVNVVDEANIDEYGAKLVKKQTITRDLVSKLIAQGAVKFKFDTFEDAEEVAREIYKKLPRYRRELGYNTEEDGAGTWESEVSDKYL